MNNIQINRRNGAFRPADSSADNSAEAAGWRRFFGEQTERISKIRPDLDRAGAERIAFTYALEEFLVRKSDRCAHCGRLETPDATLLPIGVGVRHAWLHTVCVEPWRAWRREVAVAELQAMKIET
jgi:hypothetical protein